MSLVGRLCTGFAFLMTFQLCVLKSCKCRTVSAFNLELEFPR